MTAAAVAVGLEHAVRGGAAGVDHPLRDALVIEVRDLLPEVEVLQQRRSARPRLQRVIGVGQAQALRRGQVRTRPGRADLPVRQVLPWVTPVGLTGRGAA